MKYIAGLCVGIGLGMLMLNSFGSKTNLYQEGFEDGKNYIPPVMKMIDSLQEINNAKKKRCLVRLSKMPTDSVEMIIKKAGF